MNDLAENPDNSIEPGVDNQKPETLLNPTLEAEAVSEEPAMPHLQTEKVDHGPRPENVPEDLWSAETGFDLDAAMDKLAQTEKSYKELRTKMSKGEHKAPKDGSYDMASAINSGVPEDDEMLTGFVELAKSHGISQDAFNEFTNFYLESVGAADDANQQTIAETKAQLGRNADKIIEETDRWLMKLHKSDVLSDSEVESIANASTSASFVSALQKIRGSYGEQPMPGIQVMEGQGTTRADLDALVADPRYGQDMGFTQMVETKFMEHFGEA